MLCFAAPTRVRPAALPVGAGVVGAKLTEDVVDVDNVEAMLEVADTTLLV